MRNHGWELPYHPLQTVAVAVFSGISLSFFVFFIPFVGSDVLKFHVYAIFSPVVLAVVVLYVRCAGCDPADPGVHDAKRVARAKQQAVLKSMDFTVDTGLEHSQPSMCARWLSLPFACCINNDPIKYKMGEQLLYCNICEAKISMNSKHCKACDKCVHEFDHHCRWLNNCVGKRNYKTFVSLMVACLLLLIIVWSTGIGVLVRCFTQKATFEKEISHRLGRSFPRVPYIIVVVFMSLLAMLATIPLCQLFIFHLILINKGMTTYDYILATRENGVLTEGDGFNSLTSSPASSISTEISGYSSTGALALQTGVFCTPPRMFVEHEQKVLDMESSGARTTKAKPAHSKKVSVGINPWKLARLNAAEAVKVAAQAREASTIIRPIITQEASQIDQDSSLESSRNVSGEIAVSTRKHAAAALMGKEKWLAQAQLQAARCSPSRLSGGEMRASYPGSSCPGSSPYQSCSQAASPEPFQSQEPAGNESFLLPESTSNDGDEKASAATVLHKGYLDTSVFTPIQKVAVWEDGTQENVNPRATSSGSRASRGQTYKLLAQKEQPSCVEILDPDSGAVTAGLSKVGVNSSIRAGRRESRAEANILKHVRKEWPELRDRLSDSPDDSFFSPFNGELHDSKSVAETRHSSRPPTETLQVSATKIGKQSVTKLAGARG